MKLLLVNKNPIVRKLFKLSSEKAGVEFSEIESPQEFRGGDFDLVFIDDENLEESGALERLKEELPQAKYGFIHAKDRERDSRFALFVQKPFLPTDLVDLLKNEAGNSAQGFFQSDSSSDALSDASEPTNDDVMQEQEQAEDNLAQEEERKEESSNEEGDVADDMLLEEIANSEEEFKLEIGDTPEIGDDWALKLEENTIPLSETIASKQEALGPIDLNPEPLELDFSTREETIPSQPQPETLEAQEELQSPEMQEQEADQEVNEASMQEAREEYLGGEISMPSALEEESIPDASDDGLADDVVQDVQGASDEPVIPGLEEAQESFDLADFPSEAQLEAANFDLEDSPSELELEEPKEPALEMPSLEMQDDFGGALPPEEDSPNSSSVGEDLVDLPLKEDMTSLDDGLSGMSDEEVLEVETPAEDTLEIEADSELVQEGGILDANDLQEVKDLLEEEEEEEEIVVPADEELSVNGIKIESSELAALTEEALSEALGEELPIKKEEEVFDFADALDEGISGDTTNVGGDFEGINEEITEEIDGEMDLVPKTASAPDSLSSIPANDALKSLQGLSIPALKELFDGAELTISISFPKNKK